MQMGYNNFLFNFVFHVELGNMQMCLKFVMLTTEKTWKKKEGKHA